MDLYLNFGSRMLKPMLKLLAVIILSQIISSAAVSGQEPQPKLASESEKVASGDVSREMRHYAALIKADPTNASTHYEFADFLMKRKEWWLAERELRKSIKIEPLSSKYWAKLGDVLSKTGDTSGASAAYEKAGAAFKGSRDFAEKYADKVGDFDRAPGTVQHH